MALQGLRGILPPWSPRGHYERELGLCGREALLQLLGPKTKGKDLRPPPHQE